VAINQLEAKAYRLATLSSISFAPEHSTTVPKDISSYKIDDIRQSENAWLLFNHDIVIKILRPYQDARYNLLTLHERHLCLVEGLRWNRIFSKDIHIGLAQIYHWNLERRQIGLGKILVNPRLKDLKPDAEYVLVMRKLPKECRLDILLRQGSSISHSFHAHVLSQYLAKLHAHLENATARNDAIMWGSPEQLRKKLVYNLDMVDNPEKVKQEVLQDEHFRHLQSLSNLLKGLLLPLFDQSEFADYFEQRMVEGHIKRCHGDLKARNIWILPSEYGEEKHLQEGVNVLDAIDFNPIFCNIDTLSDAALLAVDLQVRTLSPQLANYMIEDYLVQIEQTDKVSRFVLQYYLVEKAFIGAIVSILYDDLPELGESYLQAVLRNLADLRKLISFRLI